jgi:hypothetical protein
MSRRLLDARAVGYRPVDSRRWDGYLDYVSCSIEYPNTRYMVQADMRDSSELGWVVLGIEPVLLEKVHIPVQFVHRFRGKSSTHSD